MFLSILLSFEFFKWCLSNQLHGGDVSCGSILWCPFKNTGAVWSCGLGLVWVEGRVEDRLTGLPWGWL